MRAVLGGSSRKLGAPRDQVFVNGCEEVLDRTPTPGAAAAPKDGLKLAVCGTGRARPTCAGRRRCHDRALLRGGRSGEGGSVRGHHIAPPHGRPPPGCSRSPRRVASATSLGSTPSIGTAVRSRLEAVPTQPSRRDGHRLAAGDQLQLVFERVESTSSWRSPSRACGHMFCRTRSIPDGSPTRMAGPSAPGDLDRGAQTQVWLGLGTHTQRKHHLNEGDAYDDDRTGRPAVVPTADSW
jgi:hypothetical protein